MKNIWIIDDDLMLGQTIVDYLSNKNFKCKYFESGEDAVAHFSNEIPDLIICDMLLNGINGIQVLKKFIALNTGNWIPFIFLTAVKYENTHREAASLGADDYITKPFSFEELMGSINARLQKAEKQENTQKEALKKIEELSQQLTELKVLVNHKVRAYASKIWVKKEDLESAIVDPELKSLVVTEIKKILDITKLAKDHIPEKTKPLKKKNDHKNSTIFLIDDERFSLFVLEKFLETSFPKIKTQLFSSPVLGLKELSQNPPDILILDLYMPELDGFGVLLEMEKRNINVPVIVHSSTSNKAEFEKAKGFKNVKGVIGKPIKPELMQLAISNILSKN